MIATSRTVYFGSQKPVLPDPGGRLPVALAYPGPSRAAYAALGWQAVYRLASRSPWLRVERFFLSAKKEVPRSQDTSLPLDAFPLAAFSLAFELDGAVLAQALDSCGVPLLASRRPDFPILLGGGPLAFLNPAPLAPILDAWFVGEAEAGLQDLLEGAARLVLDGASKAETLEWMATRPGVYVTGRSATPVRRVWPASGRVLEDPACSVFVSNEAEFKDAMLLEVNRGCPHACRFCAAGFVYRPPRHARVEDLRAAVAEARPRKVGLVGTALTDWPDLREFLRWLASVKIKFTLSSVRASGVTEELLDILRNAGLRTLTLALEGPSARIRRKANKHLDEEAFLRAVSLAAARGVNHLKSYLIMGWPGEEDADYEELSRFLAEVCRAGRVGSGKKGIGHMTLGVNPLVPKPFTPMQWAPMAGEAALEERWTWMESVVKPLKGVRLEGERPFWARLQGLLARGGEDLAELSIMAGERGWRKALDAWGGDVSSVLDRERAPDEAFPWECVDVGVERAVLRAEWERYVTGRPSPRCPEGPCARCGACGEPERTPDDESLNVP
ncbi:Ribosomal protein S12 methylthiotransferase RimO [Fundidesulfovibrio magnetotacticus]|uniref:Ribosomal protein S12 methylthiotransferase RimO n=1 Tax=Fundidesulfovibrio magnetotacticus TaxID=2730080 RepID=A0A6V8LZ89_9BACT|nr:radical SAM protein [Fundidesulfovibrio magnetotacticus]GFK93545.1 Ribosomal protein S12 methylthiotransferase RimO [Fundidesulfovibrio magnetotacticus]